jgi:redox-sensitive bicupin YhaK (pirin superfamily)
VEDRHNKLQQVLSPNANDGNVWIHQDAWFSMGKFDKDFSVDYELKKKGNGIYAFVLNGDITIDGQQLNNRDGFGIWDTDKISIKANSQDAELLLMEVPMVV